MAGRSGKMDSPEKGRTHRKPAGQGHQVGGDGGRGESRSAVGRGWREGGEPVSCWAGVEGGEGRAGAAACRHRVWRERDTSERHIAGR